MKIFFSTSTSSQVLPKQYFLCHLTLGNKIHKIFFSPPFTKSRKTIIALIKSSLKLNRFYFNQGKQKKEKHRIMSFKFINKKKIVSYAEFTRGHHPDNAAIPEEAVVASEQWHLSYYTTHIIKIKQWINIPCNHFISYYITKEKHE